MDGVPNLGDEVRRKRLSGPRPPRPRTIHLQPRRGFRWESVSRPPRRSSVKGLKPVIGRLESSGGRRRGPIKVGSADPILPWKARQSRQIPPYGLAKRDMPRTGCGPGSGLGGLGSLLRGACGGFRVHVRTPLAFAMTRPWPAFHSISSRIDGTRSHLERHRPKIEGVVAGNDREHSGMLGECPGNDRTGKIVRASVGPSLVTFSPVQEGGVEHPESARGRVVPGEVPVAGVGRHRFQQPLHGLIDDGDLT